MDIGVSKSQNLNNFPNRIKKCRNNFLKNLPKSLNISQEHLGNENRDVLKNHYFHYGCEIVTTNVQVHISLKIHEFKRKMEK